jgi:hypothetical protein
MADEKSLALSCGFIFGENEALKIILMLNSLILPYLVMIGLKLIQMKLMTKEYTVYRTLHGQFHVLLLILSAIFCRLEEY